MKSMNGESGQTLVLVALSGAVLLGFVAFAADIGGLYQSQQNLQIAADAAATAGALGYNVSGTASGAASAAETAANENGVTGTLITSGACSGSGPLICVYTPPVDGPNTGTLGYVEVIVRQASFSGFMALFTGSNTMNVAARAVAGTQPGGCVWGLDTSGTDFEFTQSGNMTFPNCNMYGDSTSSSAINDTASGNVTAGSIGLVGGYSSSGSGTISPTPTTGIPSVPDPLEGKISPPTSFGTCSANMNVSQATTLEPGCYDGLNINAGSGTVTLSQGLYIINGNLQITAGGNTTVTGTNVVFYFPSTNDSAQITGAATVSLTAPTTATTIDGANIPANVLFYQNPNDTTTMTISESGPSTLTGIIYVPGAQLDLSGSSTSTLDSDLIVGSLDFTGSMSFEDLEDLGGPNPINPPVLVE
jgi:hypothetical protein